MKLSTSSKSSWVKFFGISLLYLLLVFADNYTTYLYTPDLSMEANPLVSLGGLGWKELIIEGIVAVAIVSFMAYLPFVYYKRTVVQCKGFREYVSKVFFKRSDKNKLFAWVPIGYGAAIAGILSRIYVVTKAIFALNGYKPCILCSLNKPHTYCNAVVINIGNGQLITPFVMLTTVAVLSLMAFFLWLLSEYKINKKALADLKTKPVNC